MAGCNQVWYHKHLGRMETEKLLMESKEDGSFLIRESDTVKGAYVLSTIYQHRIHHYRILPNEEGKLSIQAQQGVQRRQFTQIEDLVDYYSHARRGLVCALTNPIAQEKEEEEEEDDQPDDPDDSDDEAETGREKNIVSKFLLASLSTVDTAKVDDGFLDQVRTYLEKEVSQDIETMTTPIPHLRQLKQLFNKDCLLMHKQLNKIMAQLDLLKSLFDRAGGAKHGSTVVTSTKNRRSAETDMDYDTLSYKLEDCAKSVTGLETTAFQMLRELSMSMTKTNSVVSKSQPQVSPLTNGPMNSESLPREDSEEIEFECKLDQGLQGKRNVNILVNLRTCTFHFYKPGETQRQFEHHQLLQLVKSRSKETRLSIAFEGQGKKEYLFSDMRSRERFCQLTQLIRNRKRAGEEQDQDSASVFVGSWNMGDAGPPTDITSWMQSAGWGKTLPTALSQAHDLYAFGTQETSIAEKEWVAKMRQTLKQLYDMDYEKVVCYSLWGMRCLVLAKPEHMNKIAHVQTSSVKTGIGNALGNKGGVGVSFFFGSISLCFICTHLTSGNEKCTRRNQNYHDILKGMGNLKQKKLNQFDLTNQFNHLFFFGDLNYRVDMKATDIVEYAKDFDHHSIYTEDQLRKEREKKAVLVGFEEETILFPPTYRFNRGSRTLDDYVWVKNKRSGIRINVPSYCDRVLWRSYPGMRIINTSYGCSNDIMTSDHSPIFTTFQLHGIKQYVPDSGVVSQNKNALIIIHSCNAKIATSSRTNFYIEFYSTCAEGMTRTAPNNDWRHVSGESDAWPMWKTGEPLTSIRPIITEEAYLEQQHLLVMLKSQEGDEPYAECCLCLRDAIGREPKTMENDLIHQRHHVGVLEIKMHVKLDQYREKKTEDELYSDVNFITQDEPMTTLDKPGVTRSQARPTSNSESDVLSARPMQPVPRTGSQSTNEHHRVGHTVSQPPPPSSLPPPPLPSRRNRDFNTSHSNSTPKLSAIGTSATMRPTLDHNPPQVPYRRTERSSRQPEIIDRSLDSARLRAAMTATPPSTSRRRQSPGHSSPVPVPSSRSAKDALPSLPSPGFQGPPVPSRRGGGGGGGGGGPRSPRPAFSSINSLLMSHGLQQYTESLQSNGYDDPHFLADVSDLELQEIGVMLPSDREKLLRLFKSIAHSH